MDVRRDVPEADGADVPVLDARDGLEPPRGNVDDDMRLGRSTGSSAPLSSAHVTSAIVPWPHAVE